MSTQSKTNAPAARPPRLIKLQREFQKFYRRSPREIALLWRLQEPSSPTHH